MATENAENAERSAAREDNDVYVIYNFLVTITAR